MGDGFYFAYDKENDFYTIVAISEGKVTMFMETEQIPFDSFLNDDNYKLMNRIKLPDE